MKKSHVRQSVFTAIQHIQSASGRSGASLTGNTKPLGGLDGFDSLNCVEASCLLSESLGCEITSDVGLFSSNGQSFTLDQIVDTVCQIVGAEGD